MILKGKQLIIKVNGSAIAAARSCSINVQTDEIETATMSGGPWRTFLLSRKSWSISTNHLVLSIARNAALQGTGASLEVGLQDVGIPFNGFVNNVTIQSGGYQGTPSLIFWDKTLKKFVGYITPTAGVTLYFDSWTNSAPYTSPNAYDAFVYNNTTYTWLSSTLVAEKLTGNANIITWRVDGAISTLCQGGFEFHGNGPLTPSTLP